MPPRRYHPALRVLHWSIAAIVIAALLMGTFVMAPTPNTDPGKKFFLFKHMAAGLLVLCLTVARMIFRPKTRRPAPVSSGIALADWIVPYVHRLFDFLLIAMVASGIAIAALAGLPGLLLGGGALPENFNHLLPHALHVFFARSLMALLALHICGAFYHHFILRDGLIWRMLHLRGLARFLP